MSTYFIADLHLCAQQPQISKRFQQFCHQVARDARALYILGDFFEYWLGDDALDKTAQMAQIALKSLSDQGIPIFFMAGNRDFLLGEDYAQSCGMSILTEPTVIDLDNKPVLLVHGDAQCTDDVAYQKVRTMFRDTAWQQQFLSQSIEKRLQFAQSAREQSQAHTQSSSNEIMDVNNEAIKALFTAFNVDTIIHGHTHRPAIHKSNNQTRIVLGDWHHQTNFLVVKNNQYQLTNQ